MASVEQHQTTTQNRSRLLLFIAAMFVVMIAACALAGWAPLRFSIVTVFLFAGPHNWFEGRYMLSRMPARWGSLRRYFLVGLCGVPLLAGLYAAIPWFAGKFADERTAWFTSIAVWNMLLIGWIVTLALLRSRQSPRRDWNWLVPISLLLVSVNWLCPLICSLMLVYAHPLIALWFLDCEIGRQQPHWRKAYRCCLCLLPVCLGVLWWNYAAVTTLPEISALPNLSQQIAGHSGATILPFLSPHFLVATHTFLEMLHYGVWIVAIPLMSIGAWPWQLRTVPLARKSLAWRRILLTVVACGAAIVLILWAGFWIDYSHTRHIYFTIAILHVLAEFPFLLRLL